MEKKNILRVNGLTKGTIVKQFSQNHYGLISGIDDFRVNIRFLPGNTAANNHINVNLLVPPNYYGKTKGFCGVFNDKVGDDYQLRPAKGSNVGQNVQSANNDFIKSWSVPKEESLLFSGTKAVFPTYGSVPAPINNYVVCNRLKKNWFFR